MAGDPSAAGDVIDAFVGSAPDGLSQDAATMAATYGAMAEGGDPAAFSEPEFVAASAAVADAYFAGCDTATALDVSGIDYGFEGIPAEIDAGRVAIRQEERPVGKEGGSTGNSRGSPYHTKKKK